MTSLIPFIPWYLYKMVTQNKMRTHKRKKIFSENKIQFVTALDLIKGLKNVKQQRLLFTCAPISELPSNQSTMFYSHHPALQFVLILKKIPLSWHESWKKLLWWYRKKGYFGQGWKVGHHMQHTCYSYHILTLNKI